jgi:hypothetical protein
MTLYTVHLPQDAPSGEARLAGAAFVKDGFHWLALFFPFLWLLFHRIWWGLLAYVAIAIGIALIGQAVHLPRETTLGFEVLIGLFLAFAAGDMKAWQLGRRGYALVDVVSGRNEEEAERRYFDRTAFRGQEPSAAERPVVPRVAVPVRQHGPDVVGLFPDAGGSR